MHMRDVFSSLHLLNNVINRIDREVDRSKIEKELRQNEQQCESAPKCLEKK